LKYAIVVLCVFIVHTIIVTIIHINGKLIEYELDKNYRNRMEQRLDINISDKEWNEFRYGDNDTIKKLINKWDNKSK